MTTRRLTIVFPEAKEGQLAHMTTALADANINLVDLDAEEIENIGVVHITLGEEDFDTAFVVLRDSGHQVLPREVLLVKIEDRPGALAKLAVKLAEAKVNVRSMRIVKREDGYCLAAIVPAPADIARAVLADKVVA